MYVFELPFLVQKNLSDVLDAADGWEDLVRTLDMTSAALLDVTVDDVMQCRNASSRGDSSAWELLRVWGSRGHTVDQLYRLLARMRHRRAMLVLHHLIDAKYQTLLHQLPSEPASVSVHSPSSQCSKPQPVLSSAAGSQTTVSTSDAANSALLSSLDNTLSVRYSQLKSATDDFDQRHVIGKGGYGVVYKAQWKHTTVAVKRILFRSQTGQVGEHVSQQERERLRQSLMELKTLALYRHDNILPLYGYSLDGPEPCLVYQFMASGSVEDRLQGRDDSPPLSWAQRAHVCKGAACGLNFLHSITAQPLIHGDVKSANILLTAHLDAKLGDFGLSRSGQVEVSDAASPLIASHIKGTLAYLPPEFIRNKHLSSKLDVYSYGVVLLELVTGLRAYSEHRKPQNLVAFVYSNETGPTIGCADQKAGPVPETTVKVMMDTAFLCCEKNPAARPSMSDVLSAFASFD